MALYAKNNKEIEAQSSLSAFHTPPTFPPFVITLNLWIILTPTTQGLAITMICPVKATSSSLLQQPLNTLKLPPGLLYHIQTLPPTSTLQGPSDDHICIPWKSKFKLI